MGCAPIQLPSIEAAARFATASIAKDVPLNSGSLGVVQVVAKPDVQKAPAGALAPGATVSSIHELLLLVRSAVVQSFSAAQGRSLSVGARSDRIEVWGADSLLAVHFEVAGVEAAAEDGSSLSERQTIPLEVTESLHPELRFHCRELRQDSGGLGHTRGGLGVQVSLVGPGSVCATGAEVVRDGSRTCIRTSGGQGCGSHKKRSSELVFEDVCDGFVSVAAASRDFGLDEKQLLDVAPAWDTSKRRRQQNGS